MRPQICHDNPESGELATKPKKYQFMTQELVFLGYVISKHRIKPDANKIKAVSEISAPQDFAQLFTFLGMIVYVRRFIPNCGDLLTPLSMITGDKGPFLLTFKRDWFFKKLKWLLFTAPVF